MKIVMMITAGLLAASMSFAADAEHSKKKTHDSSKNVVTGTVTDTDKSETVAKDAIGEHTTETTKKTKKHKDGKVEAKTTTETKAEEKH